MNRPVFGGVHAGETKSPAPTFREALRFWLKLGFISFGGPTGQIAIMHTERVVKKKWIGEQQFLYALNYCMLLPGPEATQLATYCGWLLHRTWGRIAAGVLFVLPSAVLLWGLSFVYVRFGAVPWIAAIFYGLKPAVTAIVAVAVIRIGQRALQPPVFWGVAIAAFGAIVSLHAPFQLIIADAALIGVLGGRFLPDKFPAAAGQTEATSDKVIDDAHASMAHTRPSWRRAIKVLAVSLVLWWAPVFLAAAWRGWDGVLARKGICLAWSAGNPRQTRRKRPAENPPVERGQKMVERNPARLRSTATLARRNFAAVAPAANLRTLPVLE